MIDGRKRWLSSAAALAVLCAAPCASAAEGPRVTLRWSVPPSCPDVSRVTREVDRLLGDGSPRPAAPLDVSVTVTRSAGGEFEVHLETQGDDGVRTREIRGTSCEVVADTTALLIALIIDPDAMSRPPPEAPSPLPAPTPEPRAPSPPPSLPPLSLPAPSLPAPSLPSLSLPAPSPAPPAPSLPAPSPPAPLPPARDLPPDERPVHIGRPSIRILAWTLADAGSLPGISFAVGGKAAAVIGAFRFELGAGVWLDRRTTVAQQPSAGGDVGLVAGSAGACWSFLPRGKLELGPCLSFELGRLHADGFGGTTQGSGSALWSALQGGGLFAWSPVSWLAGVVRLDAAVPFARPTFVIEGLAAPVFRPSPVVGRATVGAEVRF
jgi:hypothetical protein